MKEISCSWQGIVWSAYNWYKGKAQSLIQLDTDLPTDIGRTLQLAAQEVYA